jgi:hypothetical protein
MMIALNAQTEQTITSNIAVAHANEPVDLVAVRKTLSDLVKEKFLKEVLTQAATLSKEELFCFNREGLQPRIEAAIISHGEAVVVVPGHLAQYIEGHVPGVDDSLVWQCENTILQTNLNLGFVLFLRKGWLTANAKYEVSETSIDNDMRNYHGNATLRGVWSVDPTKVVRMRVDGPVRR